MGYKTNDSFQSHSLIQEVKTLLFYGINVVPMNQDKQPSYPWKKYQTEMFTIEKVDQLFHQKTSIATINGEISGGLYTLDFEGKSHQVDCVYDEWAKIVAQEQPELCSKLVRYQTAGGGVHIRFRCSEEVLSSTKLASDGDQLLIELLGEGKLAICPPTPKYDWLDENYWTQLHNISADEVEKLLEISRSFDKNKKKENGILSFPESNSLIRTNEEETVGDKYSSTDDWKNDILEFGWRHSHTDGNGIEYWVRPGKDEDGHSATWSAIENRGDCGARRFYVHSTNCAPLEAGRSYSPFQLLAYLKFGGDFKETASFLKKRQDSLDVDPNQVQVQKEYSENFKPLNDISLAELMAKDLAPIKWVIPSILPSGLAMVSGRPKTGKSWLALSMGLSVAYGKPVLGCENLVPEKGPVMFCALESSEHELQQERIPLMLEAMNLEGDANIFFATEMLRLPAGVEQMDHHLTKVPDTRLFVIDVFTKIKDKKSGFKTGNIYDIEYEIMAPLQKFALEKNVVVLLVHHTRKPGPKDSGFDETSGSTAMTAAADTLMKLEKNNEEGTLSITGRNIRDQELDLIFDGQTCLWTYDGLPIKSSQKPQQRKVVELMQKMGPMTAQEISQKLGCSPNTVYQLMYRMKKDGWVTKSKDKYKLNPSTLP